MLEPSINFAYLNVIGMPPVNRMMELSQQPTLKNSRENESTIILLDFILGRVATVYVLLVEPMMA